MQVIIDRFEDDYAVVEIEEGTFALMPKVLVPNAQEGDVVQISIDTEETKKRKQEVENLMNRLFH